MADACPGFRAGRGPDSGEFVVDPHIALQRVIIKGSVGFGHQLMGKVIPHPDGDILLILMVSQCGAGIKLADTVGLEQPGQRDIFGGNLPHLMVVIISLVLHGTQIEPYRVSGRLNSQ